MTNFCHNGQCVIFLNLDFIRSGNDLTPVERVDALEYWYVLNVVKMHNFAGINLI